MRPGRRIAFHVEKNRGTSVWTEGTPTFEYLGGKNGSLWVGTETPGEPWFWMTAANIRRLRDFLTEALNGEDVT